MGLFDKIREPEFRKEGKSAQAQLEQLQRLMQTAAPAMAEVIEKDIKLLEYGIQGEKNIAFELKNSHIPMLILHDLFLRRGELSVQIDYLVITRKKVFIIECKNLFGNIEINRNGDFIRTIQYGSKSKKEAIYSPITQNKRHLEMIRELRADSKGNVLSKMLFEKSFAATYAPIVVLANPKTILYDCYAPKEIREKVIRADQLIAYIRKIHEQQEDTISEKNMEELAGFFIGLHQENPEDYCAKYAMQEPQTKQAAKEMNAEKNPPKEENHAKSDGEEVPSCPKCGGEMVLRTAAKGGNAGKQFYGCKSFPKCRGLVSFDGS